MIAETGKSLIFRRLFRSNCGSVAALQIRILALPVVLLVMHYGKNTRIEV